MRHACSRAIVNACSLLVLSGCASLDGAADDIRVGFGTGSVWTDARIDSDFGDPAEPQLESDHALGGFVEAMIEGDVACHARLFASRDRLGVADAGSSAEVQQLGFALLVSRALEPSSTFALRPMVGFGFGAGSIDFESSSFRDENGMSLLLVGGAELVVADHALLGALAWGGTFGEPGDTEFGVASVIVYAGFRF